MRNNTGPVRRYRVKRGDTLSTIARRFDTTPETIALMNAWMGLAPSRVTTWDFRPGTLKVGKFVFVPARGAGAPNVATRRPRGRRLPRRGTAPSTTRVRGLGDEFCGDGYELTEDWLGNVECVWVGSDDWSEDEYIDEEENDDGEDWKSYLSIPEVASAIGAYNSGQSGEGFANSLSAGQRAAMKGVCSILVWLATITTVIGGVFVAALCNHLMGPADSPPGADEQTYPLDCGHNFWSYGPGQPCVYAASGEMCSDYNDTQGYYRGFFNDDGDCIYNDAETSKSTPKSVCDYFGGPPGSNGWRQPGAGWFCLLPCDKDEVFDPSDGMCACKAGLKRDANMKCVAAGGGGPVNPVNPKPQPVKPPPGKPDKPQPVKPNVEKTEQSNAAYYGAAAFFVVVAGYFALKKKK